MDELKNLISTAQKQDDLFQATAFWKACVKEILIDFQALGLENFRNWPSSQKFFVPSYNHFESHLKNEQKLKLLDLAKDFEFSPKQVATFKNFYNGYSEAESDFRVFKGSVFNTKNSFLLNFSESEFGKPEEHFIFENKKYSRSSLNYLLSLACLGKFIELESIHSVIEVGGGFGTLGEIIEKIWPSDCRYLNFDIPPVCNISNYYLKSIAESFKGTNEILNLNKFSWSDLNKINVAPNWKIANFNDKIDLFINLISFQEMEFDVIKNYFHFILKMQPKYMLLRHIREGKQVFSEKNKIGVKKPTTPRIYEKLLENYKQVYSDALPFGRISHDKFHSDVLIFKRE